MPDGARVRTILAPPQDAPVRGPNAYVAVGMQKRVIVHSEMGFYMISTKEAIIKDVTSTEFFALINTQPLRG